MYLELFRATSLSLSYPGFSHGQSVFSFSHVYYFIPRNVYTFIVSTYYFQNEESSPDLMISTGFLLADWLFSFNILLFP